ncbi:MAG: AraC family transcriptional regulator [Oscillospiraceae bacterium]|nr:AraC family transcriptional regulator [Oscillospiraceae bacterium]
MRRATPFQLRLNKNLSDLNPVVAGEGTFAAGDQFNTLVAEAYMIHYVRCGSGTYHHNGKDHVFHTGQLIISRPGDVAQFGPAGKERWALRWVAFNGKLAHRFSELPIIVDAPPGTFETLCSLTELGDMLEYKLASELLFLYSALLTPQKQRIVTDPVEWVKEYVEKNYMKSITIPELAKEVGLDPDYLTRKFKKKYNLNIQSYILQTRVSYSRKFLSEGYSVKETAAMCGFNDPSSFSRAFKKYDASHRTPSHWQTFYTEFHRKRKAADQL